MSKWAKLRVDVVIDDAVRIDQVRDHLRFLLDERGTETLTLAADPPEGELAGGDMPRHGRIHWPAVIVVMHMERPVTAPKAPAKNGGRRGAAEGPANG